MNISPVTRTVVIVNRNGLHARPAQRFVQEAMQFECQITVIRRQDRVNAKSMMDMLTLGATQGTELVIEACGPDAPRALDVLSALVESGFVEEEANGSGTGESPAVQ